MNRHMIYFLCTVYCIKVFFFTLQVRCLKVSPYIHTSPKFISFSLSFFHLSHTPSEMKQTVFSSLCEYILYIMVLHDFIFSIVLYSSLTTT